MLLSYQDIKLITVCPRCRASVSTVDDRGRFYCTNGGCALSSKPFPVVNGIPVFVDFEASIISEEPFLAKAGSSDIKRDPAQTSSMSRLKRLLFGVNRAAATFARRLIDDLKSGVSGRPRILIIGGGELGSGALDIYHDETVDVVGTDIYISPFVTIVADGHQLPFVDQSIDAVWIQAVLEHVLDPAGVAAEIHRVLKPKGLVYADTPFMQQVHEGPFDFTRFSLSGHRWLFRHFELVDAGYADGPGTALRWSVGYFFRALFRHKKAGALAMFAFFWLRLFDRGSRTRFAADASSGTFFYGRKATTAISPKDIVAFYSKQDDLLSRAAK